MHSVGNHTRGTATDPIAEPPGAIRTVEYLATEFT